MNSPQASTLPATGVTDIARPKAKIGNLRALWPFVRRHMGLFIAWVIALAVASAATLSLPHAVKQMIDHGFSSGTNIDKAFIGLFGVAVVLALASASRFYFVSLLGERVVADLREQLYAHLLKLDAQFHDRNISGELVSRLSADSELLRSVVGSAMSVAVRSTVTVIGSVVMMFIASPRLASLALIGIPAAVVPIVFGARRLGKISRATQDRVAQANALAAESLGAVRTVQAYAREPYEMGRFDSAVALSVASARKRIRAQAFVTAGAITLVFGAIVLVLWLGANDVISGTITAGTLGQFVLYAMIGGGSAGSLAEVWNELQRASGGMSRIRELLDESPQVKAPSHPLALPNPVRGQIRFDHVSFRYPSRPDMPALDDFTLDIQPGETVALVGPSGAGKSTVLSMLLRFHDVQSGSIQVEGLDLRQIDLAQLRENIALVPQAPTIFATSAAENIRYGKLDATPEQIQAAAIAAEADSFLRELPEGYESQLGERGARLSGGQQQRIVIARALLKDAPILLLDEATSALDAQSEHAVQSALERLMSGRTTLVIAHRLATVLKADRIVVMDHGRIVAQGTHEALMAQGGLYSELARLQFID